MTEWEALRRLVELVDELNLKVVDIDIESGNFDAPDISLILDRKYYEYNVGFVHSLRDVVECIERDKHLYENGGDSNAGSGEDS